MSQRTAGAINYPNVINQQQEAKVFLSYKLRPGLDVGFRYQFDPYRLDDYYTNHLTTYAAKQVAGGVVTSHTPRHLFPDARFTSYHANVAIVFLRYRF